MLIGERPEEKRHPEFDAEASLAEARKRMSFEKLIEQYGGGPRGGGSWSRFFCPFCEKPEKSAGLFDYKGSRLFKCQRTTCRTGAKAMDDVGFIAEQTGVNRTEAFKVFLKMTRVWRERTTLKSARPTATGKSGHPSPQPSPQGEGKRGERGATRPTEEEHAGPEAGAPGEEATAEEIEQAFADGGLSSPGTSDHPPDPQSPGDISDAVERVPTDSVPAAADSSSLPVSSTGVSDGVSPTPDVPSNVVPLKAPPADASPAGDDSGATAGAEGGGGEESEKRESGEPEAEGEGSAVVRPVEVVRAFYATLEWGAKDERKCWEKRGLDSRTQTALGFRSNPRANRTRLQDLARQFEEDMLLESGLWNRDKETGRAKPAGKFWGWGRKSVPVVFDEEGFPVKDKTAKVEYEENEPILIPYFLHRPVPGSRSEATHELISLRPHKDMGAKGTTLGHPHLYVPRVAPVASGFTRSGKAGPEAGAPLRFKREFFRTVVITEGEFKAAALWQVLGGGRRDGRKPMGVCAIPGISFGKNYNVRQEMEEFLRMCGAEHVVVCFDNEEKGDRTKPGYKPDWRKRHDAEIWARYLAESLYASPDLNLKTSRVGRIGDEWRDDEGKADWDGMMARMAVAS